MADEKAKVGRLDHPAVSGRLFYPRSSWGRAKPPALDLDVPVEQGVTLGARFYPSGPTVPTILFFHGNGEVVDDYDDLGPLFARAGGNFLIVDYRGYGSSTGKPTASSLLSDALAVLEFADAWVSRNGFSGPLVTMGRSLGSAPAIHLAATQGHPKVAGLAVESGFARTVPLLRTLGIDTEPLRLTEDGGFENGEKIKRYAGPTLVIHGREDDLIPSSEAHVLFEASPSAQKRLRIVPAAGHNDLFARDLQGYLAEVSWLLSRAK